MLSFASPERVIDEARCGASVDRPTVTVDAALCNMDRAGRLTARRSTPARSANHELE